MTTGVTYYDWAGRPALTLDGQARAILAPGSAWTGADFLAVSRQGASIGEGAFANRFNGPPWNAPDLPGWYQRRDPTRPYDSYAKARFWASK